MDNKNKKENSKKALYGIAGVLAIASCSYRLLVLNQLEQGSLLFIGLPALITVLVIKFTGTPKSAYGISFKVITLFLLMSGIVLGEGIACIIFATPLFYGVAAGVIFINDQIGHKNHTKLKVLAIFPTLLFVSEVFTFNQVSPIHEVTVSRVMEHDVSIANLNNTPNLMVEMPEFLQLGFPKPISVTGSGINVGDFRFIQFESNTKGVGTLQLAIRESSIDKVIFEPIYDDSHINHWMEWNQVEISLSPNKDGTTTVVWRTSFRCKLNPNWYFEPLEKYAIVKSSNHLIDSYFGSTSNRSK